MGFYHYFSQKKNDFKAYPILPDKNEDGGTGLKALGTALYQK